MKLVLKKFLELPNVSNTILKSFQDADNKYPISSFLQGEYWENIKLKNPDKFIIPLSIVFDDFEINNIVGAHKKKIGGIYYTVACLPPQFLSKLENWFLAQFHYEPDYRKLGNKKILGQLREQLLELQNYGIQIEVDGIKRKVFFIWVEY